MSALNRIARAAAVAVLGVALAVLACDQGSESGTGPPQCAGGCEHIDYAQGVQLAINGAQVYRQLSTTATGTIEVRAGATVSDIEVTFLCSDGQAIHIPNDCAINELRFEVENSQTAEIHQDPAQRWFFDVTGLQAGSTRIRVLLWHDNHAHFRSELIPVNVTMP